MAECHIAMSKLTDLYSESNKFNNEFILMIILFRFYFGGVEGLAEVSNFVVYKMRILEEKNERIFDTLRMCKWAAEGNFYMFTKISRAKKFTDLEMKLINLIGCVIKKEFILQIVRSYAVLPVKWIKSILEMEDSEEPEHIQEMIFEYHGIK